MAFNGKSGFVLKFSTMASAGWKTAGRRLLRIAGLSKPSGDQSRFPGIRIKLIKPKQRTIEPPNLSNFVGIVFNALCNPHNWNRRDLKYYGATGV